MKLRQFIAQRVNTILRFDQHMLLTLHTFGATTAEAPLLYLRRDQDNGIFDQFTGHFQRIWDGASEPLEPDDDYYLAPEPDPHHQRAPTPEEAQQALERLRAHQRR